MAGPSDQNIEDVYKTVMKHGPMNPSEVVKITGIAPSSVYPALNRLAESKKIRKVITPGEKMHVYCAPVSEKIIPEVDLTAEKAPPEEAPKTTRTYTPRAKSNDPGPLRERFEEAIRSAVSSMIGDVKIDRATVAMDLVYCSAQTSTLIDVLESRMNLIRKLISGYSGTDDPESLIQRIKDIL